MYLRVKVNVENQRGKTADQHWGQRVPAVLYMWVYACECVMCECCIATWAPGVLLYSRILKTKQKKIRENMRAYHIHTSTHTCLCITHVCV